jgi:hypothetical protein
MKTGQERISRKLVLHPIDIRGKSVYALSTYSVIHLQTKTFAFFKEDTIFEEKKLAINTHLLWGQKKGGCKGKKIFY